MAAKEEPKSDYYTTDEFKKLHELTKFMKQEKIDKLDESLRYHKYYRKHHKEFPGIEPNYLNKDPSKDIPAFEDTTMESTLNREEIELIFQNSLEQAAKLNENPDSIDPIREAQ